MPTRQQRQHTRATQTERATYPRWTEPTQCPTPVVERRPLPPLLPPIATTCPNRLPGRPEGPCQPPEGYSRKRHIAPAAYPRSLKESTGSLHRASHPFSVSPRDGDSGGQKQRESSDGRKRRQLAEARECVRQNLHATPQTAPHEGEPQLWLAAECWTRTQTGVGVAQEGLTLVVSAANGFTKETWMPTIRRLLQRPPSPSRGNDPFGGSDSTLSRTLSASQVSQIDEVWFLDDYHHGQSIDLNAGAIGAVHAWVDGGRDILNFVKHVLPQHGSGPTSRQGERPSNKGEEAEVVTGITLPWCEGGSGRKVIGIGHSVGGNAMVRAAHLAPELFHALFLVEPMTPPLHFVPEQLDVPEWPNLFFRPVVTMKRRSTWASMAEALKVRETSAFFKSWHEDVWRVWESHHLVPSSSSSPFSPSSSSSSSSDDPSPSSFDSSAPNSASRSREDPSPSSASRSQELATPTWAEAAVFAESTGLAEGWDTLPLLGQLPCGFLMAGEATSTMGEDITREMVWRPPVAANERIMDAGHLIVHEKPDQVADAIRRFIDTLTVRPDRAVDEEGIETPKARL